MLCIHKKNSKYPRHPLKWTVVIKNRSDNYTGYSIITVFTKKEAREIKRRESKGYFCSSNVLILPPYLE